MKNKSQAIKILFFLSLGLGLAYYSIKDLSWGIFWSYFSGINFFFLTLTVIVGMLSHISRALRWQIAIAPTGQSISFANSFLAIMIGYFANLIPPRVGEFIRCALVEKYEKIPTQTTLGTVVAERVIDTIILGMLFVINLAWQYDILYTYSMKNIIEPLGNKMSLQAVMILLAFATVMGLIVIFINQRSKRNNSKRESKIRKLTQGFVDGLRSVTKLEKPITYAFHTIFIWFCYVLMIYLGFWSFPSLQGLSMQACLSVFIFGTVGMIVTPGGTGAYPALVAGALALYGVNTELGSAFGWIIWGTQTFLFIIFGILSLVLLPIINRNGI